ncbi:MAG: hypothetical protein ACYTGC_10525 [Planctomycetota bacterium]|jgi:hypothetical protein
MLRAIRNKLREIDYYSATRTSSFWRHMADRALVLSLVLAWPCAWLMTVVVQTPGRTVTTVGRLAEHPDGSVTGWLIDDDLAMRRHRGEVIGGFELTLLERVQGWPFATRRDVQPPRLTLDLYREPQARPDARLAADDPLRAAIGGALDESGPAELAEAWRISDPPGRPVWRGWIASTMVWAVLLAAGSSLSIAVLAYGSRWRRAKHLRRSAERKLSGKCGHCGYDLRGLEFSEVCPECGNRT